MTKTLLLTDGSEIVITHIYFVPTEDVVVAAFVCYEEETDETYIIDDMRAFFNPDDVHKIVQDAFMRKTLS